MADWAGNDTGAANDVNSNAGADVGSSSASGNSSGGDYTEQKYGAGTLNPVTGVTTYEDRSMSAGEIATAQASVAQATIMAAQNPYAVMTEQKLQTRPDYTPPAQLGDPKTEAYENAIRSGFAAMNMATGQNFGLSQEDTRIAALAFQMGNAQARNDYRATQYFGTELNKGAENKVARASEYHYIGKLAAVPIPANPYEYQGDLAVEYLKGRPQSDKEMFSPVSGQISAFLPYGGYGLQQYQWDLAKANLQGTLSPSAYNVNFAPATAALINATGNYGPYGSLYGGPDYRGTPSSEGLRMQTPTPFTNAIYGRISAGLTSTSGIPTDTKSQMPSYAISSVKGERVGIVPTSPMGVEMGMAEGSIPKPFRSGGNITTTSKPSERWETGIPLIGGFIPAGIFNPTSQIREPGWSFAKWIAPVETTTTTDFGSTTINRSDMPKMAGAEATMMFIGADNKPTRILTEKTGAPYEKGGQIFQDYTTTDISKVTMGSSATITTVGNSPASSMWEKWNTGASKAMGLPPVSNEQIKQSAWMAGIIPGGTPFAIAAQIPGVDEYAVSYLQGEYTGMRTRPLDTVVFTGVGIAMGGITKGAENVYAPVRAGMAEPAIASRGGRLAIQYSDFLTTKAIPYSLVGMYGTDVAGRSTEWGRDFSPMAAQRFGGIVSTEARPMAIGTMVGYTAPGKVYDATTRAYELEKINYKAYQQEGGTGVFQYTVERAGFNKSPASPEISRPNIAPENEFATGSAYGKQPTIIEYIKTKGNTPVTAEPKTLGNYAIDEFATTGAYGKQRTIIDVLDKASRSGNQIEPYRKFFTEKTSNTLSQKAYPEASEPMGIRVKSYLQERGPLFESTKDNIIYPKQKIADYNKMYDLNKKFYSKNIETTKGTGNIPAPPKANAGLSRTTNQIVGGKSVRGLTKEPSLRSQGIPETSLPEGKRNFASQHSVDFRGNPKSSTMKPMGKQAAGQIQTMREPLPITEGMTQGKISPVETQRYPLFQTQIPQQRQTTETMMEISPRLEFMQDYQRRQELSVGSPTTLGNLQNQLQMQKPRKELFVGMESTQKVRAISPMIEFERAQPDSMMRTIYGQTSDMKTAPFTEQRKESSRIPISSTRTTPLTTTRITQKRNQITIEKIISKPTPPTPPPPVPGWGLPPSGGRGSPQRGYGLRSAVATHPVGADLLGVSRGTVQPMAMPRQRKSKKMGMPSFRMPRF